MTSPRLWMIGLTTVFGLTLFTVVDGALAKSGQADPGYQPKAGSSHAVTTFYADVMPILQENCVDCHQPQGLKPGGMVAPMSFMTYEETRRWAPAIARSVMEGRMPPWFAAPEHRGTFRDERYLEEDEKAVLAAWAEDGAPAGDAADAPPMPAFSFAAHDGWSIGEPDLVITFPEPFLVEDDVVDLYVDIPLELTADQLSEPRWVKARETRPGSPAVHHILGAFAGLAPGSTPTIYEEGYSTLLHPGPRTIEFQMHYNKKPGAGTAVYDQSSSGVVFYEPGDTIRHVVQSDWLPIMRFLIPAGDPNYSASMVHTFEEDMQILSFSPHMHLRGKAAKYEITYPDGETEVLLHVPKYDFNWQHGFRFKEPVLAPKGSELELTLWWDNSADNPSNPDPTRDVRFGRPTTDEMGFGFMSMTPVEPREIIVGEPIPEDILGTQSAVTDTSDPASRR